MRPQLLKVSSKPEHSFSTRQDLYPHVNNRWHYHVEFELIHFNKGAGTQFIGDSISRFSEGNVILVGKNLPHYWRFDDIYFNSPGTAKTDVRVAHFRDNVFGSQFLDLPETLPIRCLLDKARRGIKVEGFAREAVAEILDSLLSAEGPDRIILLLRTLSIIAASKENIKLCSARFRHSIKRNEEERINAIYEYSIKNFKRKIFLDEIASIAHISPNSFCRYFKSITGRTYSGFLLELKIGEACQMLMENKYSIKQVCFESGFNNFSAFHKYFKLIKGQSPGAYKKEFYTGLD